MFPSIPLNGTEARVAAAVVAVVLGDVWIAQFATLMSYEDDAFPGAYARFGWMAAFITLWFLAPFAFLAWRWPETAGWSGRAPGRVRWPT